MGHPSNRPTSHQLDIIPAHPDAAYWWADHMREADVDELLFTGQDPLKTPAQMLESTMSIHEPNFLLVDGDDVIHGMWGHGPWPKADDGPPTPDGFIWLVSDDVLFEKHPVEMTRRMRFEILPALLDGEGLYKSVGNFVHSENEVHLRWLQAAGFSARYTAEFGGATFILMSIKADV